MILADLLLLSQLVSHMSISLTLVSLPSHHVCMYVCTYPYQRGMLNISPVHPVKPCVHNMLGSLKQVVHLSGVKA